MTKRFITIAGNIGSGKTTLTRKLSEHYQWAPYFEAVGDNPYLADFYQDMKRWSLPLQVFFLSKRFKAHQEITMGSSSAIQDRSVYEDKHIFASALHESGFMSSRDFENYKQLHDNMIQFLTPPDLMVYVRRSVPYLQSRIEERGRDYEQDISEAYLADLNQRYDNWIERYRIGRVLVLSADHLDFKSRKEDFDYVCEKIENALEQPEFSFVS